MRGSHRSSTCGTIRLIGRLIQRDKDESVESLVRLQHWMGSRTLYYGESALSVQLCLSIARSHVRIPVLCLLRQMFCARASYSGTVQDALDISWQVVALGSAMTCNAGASIVAPCSFSLQGFQQSYRTLIDLEDFFTSKWLSTSDKVK